MSLGRLRREARLTLHGLAEKSGVHYMKIHQIEKGKIKPENISLRTALKLSAALGCKPDALVEIDSPGVNQDASL